MTSSSSAAPCQLPPRVLRLVVSLEAIVYRDDCLRDDEVVRWRVQRPEVRAKDHDAEVDVVVVVVLCHALLKLLSEVLAERHVWAEIVSTV